MNIANIFPFYTKWGLDITCLTIHSLLAIPDEATTAATCRYSARDQISRRLQLSYPTFFLRQHFTTRLLCSR